MATEALPGPATTQPTVFVSYAREDSGFVRELRRRMEAAGLRPQGDWLLVPGDRYESRLREMLLAADAFVFVITPDSVRSSACRLELAGAVEHRKPVLPLSHREHGDDDVLDSALRAPQWIIARDPGELDEAVAQLAQAVRTDFELMDVHARLLAAADAWSAGGREPGYLLRAEGLAEAEAWLTRTSAHPDRLPQPTPLQLELIFASQRARTRGARKVMGIASAVIVALAVLAGVAWTQRSLAVDNAQESGRQARIARTQTLEAVRQRAAADSQRAIALRSARREQLARLEADSQRAIAVDRARREQAAREQAEQRLKQLCGALRFTQELVEEHNPAAIYTYRGEHFEIDRDCPEDIVS